MTTLPDISASKADRSFAPARVTARSNLPLAVTMWYEVQAWNREIFVVRHRGLPPYPRDDHILLRIVAAGLCNADVKVWTGEKERNGKETGHVTPGHEGVGVVVAVGADVRVIQPGDHAAVLPHLYPKDHELRCRNPEKGPRCIGRGCPVHMGFATDGVFADYVEVPATNVVRIAPRYVEMASKATQGLPRAAVFAFCEPILCTLTAYVLMAEESRRLLERDVQPGRAIVLGAGPMGFLWALVLVNKGWSVWLVEPIVSRARIVRACLDNRVDHLDSNAVDASFELAVVTAPHASAIQRAEELVKERGTVYLFAGLVKEDREAMDPDHLLRYERLHRVGKGTRTTTNVKGRDKELLYVGSSGYRDALALTSVSFVANHAATLDRAVSGLIHGWTASRVEARLPGGIDVDAKDGVPAIVRLLHGLDVRQGYLKILILGSEPD